MYRLLSVVGLLTILFLAWLFSADRKRINYRTVVMGVALQLVLGLLLITFEPTARLFELLAGKVAAFLNLSEVGAKFVFGNLADQKVMDKVFEGALGMPGQGFVILFKILPTIIFFAAFISILYHLGVMQPLVELVAKVMRYTMKTSGAETLACASNIFLGMTEAPLLIRPFLEKMTLSELNAVMIGGFATIAGSVMAAYIAMGISPQHIIIASIMSAPGALVVAKMLLPETEHSETAGDTKLPRQKFASNILDAATRGTTDGLQLAINVIAMLIAFLSLLAFADVILAFGDRMIDHRLLGFQAVNVKGEYLGIFPGSLATLFGYILSPIAWVLGVPWGDAKVVGKLLGIQLSSNECVAYSILANHIKGLEGYPVISERAQIIATYALCAFANFGSIGIQIGGISAIAPSRRADLAKLGFKAMIAGAMASWMTAAIVGILIP